MSNEAQPTPLDSSKSGTSRVTIQSRRKSRRSVASRDYSELDTDTEPERPKSFRRRKSVFKESVEKRVEEKETKV